MDTAVTSVAMAALLAVAHSAMIARAAPAMFQIGRAGDDHAALAPFARWSAARAVAQTATLIVVAIAIAQGT